MGRRFERCERQVLPRSFLSRREVSELVGTEDWLVPSTDSNIALFKAERGAAPRDDVVAWVLDESKAHRQIAVRQDHRRYTVMASTDPSRPRVGYFVLLVHSFGLPAAVFPYNRSAALLTQFFVRECRFVVQNYYG